jgi:hypothetical protein
VDRLDRLALEARELLAEMDAVLASFPSTANTEIATDEISTGINIPINDDAEDWS